MTTGKIGIKFSIYGIKLEVSYTFEGGGSISLGVKGSLSQSQEESNIKLEHKSTMTDKGGFTLKFCGIGIGQTFTTETTRTLSTNKGAEKTTESTNNQNFYFRPGSISKQGLDIKNGIEVNLLIIGVGAEVGTELTTPK